MLTFGLAYKRMPSLHHSLQPGVRGESNYFKTQSSFKKIYWLGLRRFYIKKGQTSPNREFQWYFRCKTYAALSLYAAWFPQWRNVFPKQLRGINSSLVGDDMFTAALSLLPSSRMKFSGKKSFFSLRPQTETSLLFKSLRYHLNVNIPNVTASILNAKTT